jgi:DNA mismatch repair protein MutS
MRSPPATRAGPPRETWTFRAVPRYTLGMSPTDDAPDHALPPADDPALQTPMMQQYFEARQECPDALLLFRMGDFYECFLEDAIRAARILELTLTARNKKDEHPIPMAGLPYHALPSYLPRLLSAGEKVAICEQVEDPKLAKGLVKRAVVRIITPGVVLEPAALDGRESNWLAAICRAARDDARPFGLAWLDVSTGLRFGAAFADEARALAELARLEPSEIVTDPDDPELSQKVRAVFPKATLTPRAMPGSVPMDRAAAALEAYARAMYREGELALQPLQIQPEDGILELPASTVRNLELLRTLIDGQRDGSLLAFLDATRTAMGSRLLKRWLLTPLGSIPAIRARQRDVVALADAPSMRADLRAPLRQVADLERLMARVAARSAGPRELVALAASLEVIPSLAALLAASAEPALVRLGASLVSVPAVSERIRGALVDDPPVSLKDGGVIREGVDPELDRLNGIAREGRDWFLAYGERLKAESGINSLKIKYNGVFGYFIEVTKANLHMVPSTWLRKQTLVNAERYYTAELKEREEDILGAEERRLALEQSLFEALRADVAAMAAPVQAAAASLAELDVLAALAEVGRRHGWTLPELVEAPVIDIRSGRHPVVEANLPTGEFVPNDVAVDGARPLMILTGPNMAGKSTVMRQTALIAILAHMGSLVPAESATIGLIDRLFTRVGASDDLAHGRSTFMVEMTETAEILTRATSRSLVILDEIGRGTSTWDGLSLAWSIAEHVADSLRARTLFATHYHELTALADTRDTVANFSIAVREWEDDIVFLRRLIPGGASRSYGIQVARLAGVPQPIVERAKQVLTNLEAMAVDPDAAPRLARGGATTKRSRQLSLFALGAPPPPSAEPPPPPPPDPVRLALDDIHPDTLTPRDAHALLYRLKELATTPPPTSR